MRFLITGARAPAAMEWGRILSSAGHSLWFADSFSASISRYSRCSRGFISYPSPRFKSTAFIEKIRHTVEQLEIDWILPTCEEIYYLALHRSALGERVRLFADSYSRLLQLHDKYRFIHLARDIDSPGIAYPVSTLLRSPEEAQRALKEEPHQVLKPVFSRFGTEVCLPPLLPSALPEGISAETPWIAQEFIQGELLCSYSIAWKGRLRAHTVYGSPYKAGEASVYFKHRREPLIEEWTRAFMQHFQIHGQLSLDWIKTEEGTYYPIECNPRSTSGIHNFSGISAMDQVFSESSETVLYPGEGCHMIKLAMGLARPRKDQPQLRAQYRQDKKEARDVISRRGDRRPGFMQYWSYFRLFLRALKNRQSPVEASVEDILHSPSDAENYPIDG